MLKKGFRSYNSQTRSAYTLLEMSIVILISAILITGSLSAAIESTNNKKIRITQDRFRQIYSALGAFLATNGRLPCPAEMNLSKTNVNYGSEVAGATDCLLANKAVYKNNVVPDIVYGMVPTKALNIASDFAEDGFENKIAYIIDKRFARVQNPTTPNFVTTTFGTTPSAGTITINQKPIGSTAQTATDDAIMVLISYGQNGFGGVGSMSANLATNISTIQNTPPTDVDEVNNYPDTSTAVLPGNPPVASYGSLTGKVFIFSSGDSDVFDDQLFFKSRNEFVTDFDLMNLIACNISSIVGYGAASVYYGTQVVNTASPCALSAYRLIKKCDSYGIWSDVISACPV